jgi:hypothetical protein
MRKGPAEPVERCVADAGAASTTLRPVDGRLEVSPGGLVDGVWPALLVVEAPARPGSEVVEVVADGPVPVPVPEPVVC